jgi:hypothetical protein
MTDSPMLAGGVLRASCGAVCGRITHAAAASRGMDSGAAGEFALSAAGLGAAGIGGLDEGGNGAESGETRFVICCLLIVSLGEIAGHGSARRLASCSAVAGGADLLGGLAEFQEGGRGSRARRERVLSIHRQPKKIFTLPQPMHAMRCPQCLLSHCIDCLEVGCPYPAGMVAKKEGRADTPAAAAAVSASRCPQCLIASPIDCQERPCGWPEKKKGGAA